MAAGANSFPRRSALRLGFTILALAATALAGDGKTPAATEPFERALVFYAQGDLQQAQTNLEQALAANPSDRRACTLLSVVQRERGRKPAACDAAAPLPATLTPAQLLQTVAARNPEIGQAVMQVAQARAELRMAKLAVSPEFSALGRFYPSGVLLSLTQSLLGGLFQRPAMIHEREARLLGAVANYARVRDDVLDRAAASYFSLREAQESIPLLEGGIAAATELRRVALVRAEYGGMLQQQQLEYDRELAEGQTRLRDAQGKATVATATLNLLMGSAADEPLSIAAQDLSVNLPADYRQVLETARQKRPEIEQALRAVEAAKAGRQAAMRDLLRIDLRATWGSSSNEGRGEFLTGPSVGVRVTVPLLIVPMMRARSRREQAVVSQLEFELGRIVAQTQLENVVAWEQLMKAGADLEQANQAAATAREAVRVQQARQVQEGGDLLRLATAQIEHAQAGSAALARKFAVQRAAYHLQRSMGIPSDQPLFEVAGPGSASEAVMQKTRAMWVWKPAFLDDQAEATYLLDFAAARQVGTLFLSASANSLGERGNAYRALLAAAHARKMKVEALQGEPEWALNDHRDAAARFVEAVVRFNQAAAADARFDGIHLDVEPHTLPAWKSGRQEQVGTEFMELLARSSYAAHAAGLKLSVDINPVLERVTVKGGSLVELILGQADTVAIMAYRDSSEKVVRASNDIAQRAAAAGKGVWIGLSADRAHLPSDPGAEGSDAQLESMATAVEQNYAANKSFIGVAIHDYARYRNLILDKDTQEAPSAAAPGGAPTQ